MVVHQAKLSEARALVLLACIASACSAPPSNGDSNDIDGVCTALELIPDREDLSSSPRADVETEMLALTCSQGWVADQEVYDQLVDDLAAIRQADPQMAQIRDHRASAVLQDKILLQAADDTTLTAFLAGDDASFQCVMDVLGASGTPWSRDEEGWATITFDGVYHLDGIAQVFSAVDGVVGAESNSVLGDGDTIRFDLRATPRRYLFEQGGGDCPAGCTTHRYYLWEIDDGTVPARVAEWSSGFDGESGTPPANFSFDDFECRRCEGGRVAQGEAEICDDGIDNDCDGRLDCRDEACADAVVCVPEDCGNGVDDDGDTAVDCDDDSCAFDAQCGGLTCGSPEDRAFISGLDRGVLPFVLRDALACDPPREPHASIAACITSTFTNNGASHACGACLGDFGQCAMTDCRDVCFPDYMQPACVTCYETNCIPATDACLGEPVATLGG